jgi:DNA-binding Xre family transcriptional regulator
MNEITKDMDALVELTKNHSVLKVQLSETAEKILQTLGDNIRVQRRVKGFTQDELAAMVGLSRTQLTNIELGVNTRIPTFIRICLALGTNPNDILNFPSARALSTF